MPAEVRIVGARLPIARGLFEPTRAFYAAWGAASNTDNGDLELLVGISHLVFAPADSGRPFHHFALLVPGDRFEAAHAWLAAQADLLSEPDQHETIFEFENWNARACYVLDPAGNIVELIAHHDLDRSGRRGRFSPEELRGISEVGLVLADKTSALTALRTHGLMAWSGAEAGNRLLFVGEKAHTLILASPGRGWLPTGRPAEPWAASVLVTADEQRVPIHVDAGTLRV